jgi:alkaline phosphatase
MISDNFRNYSGWNGKGVIVKSEQMSLLGVIEHAKELGKPVRFWGSPDEANAWIQLKNIGVTVLNTDKPGDLAVFLERSSTTAFTNRVRQPVYTPTNRIASAKKPKNVIFLIGDGMGLAQVYSAYTANYGALNLFQIRDIGLSLTHSSDSYITDSAAGATAMACGEKTNNRALGVDPKGKRLKSILSDLSGYCTTIITMGDVTDATPAAFYAHQPDRSMTAQITDDYLKQPSDMLIGGGAKHFLDREEAKHLSAGGKLTLTDDSVISKMKGRGDYFRASLNASIRHCSSKGSSFFIVAEGAQIDHGGHQNNMEYVVSELLDFDQAVGAALRFADDNKETLVLITADHETGGLSLLDGDFKKGYVHGHFSTSDHTGIPVPVFAYGPGSENFRGVYQNTEIYHKLKSLLRNDK